MPVIDLGSVIGPQGPQGATGATGATGAAGAAGPNVVSTSTTTGINGILGGNGSKIIQVASDSAPTENSNNLVRSGAVYTAVQRKTNSNLLNNWCFAGGGSQQGGGQFPINHKAQTLYPAGTSYCIDRWRHTTSYTTTQLYSGYLLLSAAGGSSDYGYIEQFISWSAIRGKAVTFSVLYLDSNNDPQLAYGSGTTFSNPPAQGTNAVIRINDLIPNGAGCGFYITDSGVAYVQIGQTPGNSIKLIAVKLELGTQQTLAHRENGGWTLNDVPNIDEQQFLCFTNREDSGNGQWSGFYTVGGKVSPAGKPYFRFSADNGYQYQLTVTAGGNLVIQQYDGTTWTNLAEYAHI